MSKAGVGYALSITIRGRVQGVGFRPHVYRLAGRCGVTGFVCNTGEGARVVAEGSEEQLARFLTGLTDPAPAPIRIESLQPARVPVAGHTSFRILDSAKGDTDTARVPVDVAVCPDCVRELFDPADRRFGYPFLSCTACGPRYGIIAAMPYDRPATAMSGFPLCSACAAEYRDPEDRRFHAQPIACPECGPRVALLDQRGCQLTVRELAISFGLELLRGGGTLAVKGLGGYQLVVAADQPGAVRRLRERKRRPTKPLAVMVRDLAQAHTIVDLTHEEVRALTAPANPIVLARRNPAGGGVCEEVAPGLDFLGVFLPTTPLHHLLVRAMGSPLVVTSGNVSGEPIVTEESEAIDNLGPVVDAFLTHDRPITRRLDDSVVRLVAGQAVPLRLARGYAPCPLPTLEGCLARLAGGRVIPPLLAVGGHQKVAVALWTGAQAVLSQHVGDLDNLASRDSYESVIRDLCRLFRCDPQAVAHDLHPDYATTRWATDSGLRTFAVQHHHAHAVACLVDNDRLDTSVLAFTWDGSGYGPDGMVWGGETLLAEVCDYRRVASLSPLPLPGGEAAIRHPNRLAAAALACLDPTLVNLYAGHLRLDAREASHIARMVHRNVRTVWTSSVGRLFDVVAALVLGCTEAYYEGEAAVRLESAADPNEALAYPLPLLRHSGPAAGEMMTPAWRGDWRPLLRGMLRDLAAGAKPQTIAGRFHNTLAQWAGAVASVNGGPTDVVLGGGCFQNGLLTDKVRTVLREGGHRVHTHRSVPPGDGGLAVGQLAVALTRSIRGGTGVF